MVYSKHWFIFRANVIADLGALVLAVLLAATVSGQYLMGFSLTEILAMRFSLANIGGAVFLAVLWVLIFQQHLYRPRRLRIGLLGRPSLSQSHSARHHCFRARSVLQYHPLQPPSTRGFLAERHALICCQLLLRSLRKLNLRQEHTPCSDRRDE